MTNGQASVALTSVTPTASFDETSSVFTVAFGDINPFGAAASGSFSSDAVTASPEPATFAMLGAALVLGGLFGRKKLQNRR